MGTGESNDAQSEPGDGIISIRGGLVGLGYIWLTAVSAFVAIGAAVYGFTVSLSYLLVAVIAAAVAVKSGSASLRRFGYQ